MMRVAVALLSIGLIAPGCQSDSLSSAEAEQAAKERVRQKLGLNEETALFSTTWVGESDDGEPVLCGTVAGAAGGAEAIAPRKFIAAIEPANWILFEPASNASLPSEPGKFVEWDSACEGRRAAV